MDAFERLKREKKHYARLLTLEKRVYRRVCGLSAEYAPSREPVPAAERDALRYRPIWPGGVWARLYGCAWFRLRGEVPASARGAHVVAHIELGGEALLYKGPEPVAAISATQDFIDEMTPGRAKSIVEVASCAQGGERVLFELDAGFNHFRPALQGVGAFRRAELCVCDDALKAYFYDYLTVASLLSVTEEPARRVALSGALEQSYAALQGSSKAARAVLAPLFCGEPDARARFTAMGHSHLDLAWLWPLRETRRKAARTFAHQLANMARWPDYVYGASQPQQFEWIKERCPAQYEAMRARFAAGQMEAQGAMWVESDTNLVSGEALVRQLWYGKQFFKREFGKDMQICWLPDVFGYNGNLPQILKKSGVPYFLTIKLSWNEHNKFPHRSFVWKGIDGSEVLVHMPPAETYNSPGSPACTAFARDHYPERGDAPEALLLCGIGDGGGGPGEAHIEMLRRQTRLDGSPSVSFGTAADFFARLNERRALLPSYCGELYLEKHQGTYTTQGANKRANRLAEYAMQTLEALCALAYPDFAAYPAGRIDAWWKELLLYQFHDIIPGSSIARVYEETRSRYKALLAEIGAETQRALAAVSKGDGKSVFNPAPYAREGFLCEEGRWQRYSAPAHGFARLAEANAEAPARGADFLENAFLRVVFNETGEISSLVDKRTGREYARGALNVLRLYQDPFLHYNAWDIDWKYMEKPAVTLRAYRRESFADGPRAVYRHFFRHGRTRVTQEVYLLPGSPVLYFQTECDYRECLRMLRADFDTTVFPDEVLCDIQFGSIRRSAHDATPQEKAQFEICAHKYVDISARGFGLSLLNDCKYGHRAKENFLSLNLLRAPVFPDRTADRHAHAFTYALYPHAGACGPDTLREAYLLNKPPVVFSGAPQNESSLAETDNPAVVVETVKRAYDGRGIIVRLYESQGKAAVCSLSTRFPHKRAVSCTLLEEDGALVTLNRLTLAPFELVSLRLSEE